MRKGDLVRITRQSTTVNAHIRNVGMVGFVDEVYEDRPDVVAVQGLKRDGSMSGWGAVPVKCLEPETASKWVEAKAAYDRRIKQLMCEGEERARRHQEAMKRTAERAGLAVEQVDEVLEAWAEEWREDYC